LETNREALTFVNARPAKALYHDLSTLTVVNTIVIYFLLNCAFYCVNLSHRPLPSARTNRALEAEQPAIRATDVRRLSA